MLWSFPGILLPSAHQALMKSSGELLKIWRLTPFIFFFFFSWVLLFFSIFVLGWILQQLITLYYKLFFKTLISIFSVNCHLNLQNLKVYLQYLVFSIHKNRVLCTINLSFKTKKKENSFIPTTLIRKRLLHDILLFLIYSKHVFSHCN